MEWITPAGKMPLLCADMTAQPHIMIAGATGSGKSVLLHSFIYTLLFRSPSSHSLVLIDPKRVELWKYRQLPHCLQYASEPAEMARSLSDCVQIMENRFRTMRRNNQTQTEEKAIYIIIDEFADLMTTQKRETLPALQRIAQLGRAARLHLVLATQRPTGDVINGKIKVNIDCRLALRCPTAQDSRNIINQAGAEQLPRFGFGYYLTPETVHPVRVEIPYTSPDEITARCNWWTGQARQIRRSRHWWQK
jgi:S-DNA-T family DNA segregation ATPase FtsK/SpoIIIE